MDYQVLLQEHPALISNENALIKVITDKDQIASWIAERKRQLAAEGMPTSWAEVGVVYEDPYIVVIRDLVEFPSGNLGTYFRIINRADLFGGKGAVILPIYEGKIVTLRQFRHPTRSWHWEVPRGFGEPQTTAEDNARLEIQEEIHGIIAELVDLGPYHNNTGAEGGTVELFLARLSGLGSPNAEEGIKEYRLFEIADFERMIRDAEITDGFSIAAFTRARLRSLL